MIQLSTVTKLALASSYRKTIEKDVPVNVDGDNEIGNFANKPLIEA